MTRALYFVVASVLVGFGAIAILSIGFPFFAIGMAMLILAPFRDRPAVFWPALGAILAFFVGYVLVAPLTCTTQDAVVDGTGEPTAAAGRTTCTNLLGIDYRGTGSYDPPRWPAVVAGSVLAGTTAVVLRRVLTRRGDDQRGGTPPQDTPAGR